MPLTFVHGVAIAIRSICVRIAFDRDEFFRALVLRPMGLDDAKVKILNHTHVQLCNGQRGTVAD